MRTFSTISDKLPQEAEACAADVVRIASAARPMAVRRRAVIGYVLVALLALTPGVLARFEIKPGGTSADLALEAITSALDDIRFGSGLRFWLGVMGASMMGLLVLYPLRKVLSRGRKLGSVGAWFHIHMLLGLGGPVAILYHANFGQGSSNANVALWAMLTVVVSGILGFFVYGRASAEFYSVRQRARAEIEAIRTIVDKLDVMPMSKRHLLDDMEAFEADLLAPRKGVMASARARIGIERRGVQFARAIDWLIAEYARAAHLAPPDARRLRVGLMAHLAGFMGIARHASGRSIQEQIWARWRLFHLPVFLIMVVAALLHVHAVWDMAAPVDRSRTAQVPDNVRPETGSRMAAFATGIRQSPAAKSIEDLLGDQREVPSAKTKRSAIPLPTVRSVTTLSMVPGVAGVAIQTAPTLVEAPKLVRGADEPLPASAPVASRKDFFSASGNSTPPSKGTTPQVPDSVAAKPLPLKVDRAAVPESVSATVTKTTIEDKRPDPAAASASEMAPIYDELKRKTEEPRMALGGSKRTLAEQIAEFKGKMALKQFVHSVAETGFLLSGKHMKLDCTQCHTKPMQEQRSTNPRQCIDCHKKDDVHKGRQPECVDCHTTNRWSQILKRK